MRKFRATAAVCLVAAFGGLAVAHDMALQGTEWGVVGDPEGKGGRFVSFAGEGRVFGFAGCNRFSGEYLQSGERLMIKPLATTRMACPDDAMAREQEFLEALGGVRSVRVEHSMLMMLDEQGRQITTLIRRGGA